jgi:hypothetical protein
MKGEIILKYNCETFEVIEQMEALPEKRAALVHRDPLVGGEETPEGWDGARRFWVRCGEP